MAWACPDLLNYVDFPNPSFLTQCGGTEPPPSSQPLTLEDGSQRTEVDNDSVLLEEQARLGDFTVRQYLFIYSP